MIRRAMELEAELLAEFKEKNGCTPPSAAPSVQKHARTGLDVSQTLTNLQQMKASLLAALALICREKDPVFPASNQSPPEQHGYDPISAFFRAFILLFCSPADFQILHHYLHECYNAVENTSIITLTFSITLMSYF